jgi:hypothetical protein
MTDGERLYLSMQMTNEAYKALCFGDPEIVARRFELLRRENDYRNRKMCEAFAKSKEF